MVAIKRFASIIFVVAAMAASAQSLVDTSTQVFDSSFKSLKVAVEGNDYVAPVVLLGGDSRIRVEFDQISPEMQYLRYSVMHCDADWQPSMLVDSEYVDGFNEAEITDYAYSSGTLVNYVHYALTLPNDDISPTISGNYLLKVYPENEPDNVCLQVRFSLYEDKVGVVPAVTSRTDIDYNKSHQQLSVEVDTRNYAVDNMYMDLKVRVVQNGRADNLVAVNQPQRVASRRAFFEHNRSLIFPAGNEYRRFEAVTTNYHGIGVDYYQFNEPYYHVVLKVDEPRAYDSYTYDRTQFGRFTIRQSDVDSSDTQAEYMVAHFALAMPELQNGDMYVVGEFTQDRCNPANRMYYNHNEQRYEAEMLVKMGSYNYQYFWVADGGKPNPAVVEGDFYQTVNEYTVYVYHRPAGCRYDRLVGFTTIFSGN
ncbi:MAG: DUF5103 domain-containing protein [Candidatus Limisoma sp.]|nr:DUF5103 domain-containing protein [Bacteroidales bacterium]MDY5893192.1 DUF5103 domain-containing protein [Candidatus Limisoma sp.]